MGKKDCINKELDIAVLKEQMDETKEFINEMKEKHLPHIYKTLNEINLKLAKLNIWDKIKSISLIIASGLIGSMAAYIFLTP